jgi:geranylgeranyl reductase family protein
MPALNVEDIIIVGAGPAGAYLAYLLARNGIHATIFDDSHPREKPCGGAISPLALKKFPILERVPHSRTIDRILAVSSQGREAMLHVPKNSGMVVSREHLDWYLLQQAVNHGAKLVRERVIDIEGKADGWNIRTQNGEYSSRIVIGADGVSSVVRSRILGHIPRKNIAVCIGYFAGGYDKDYGIIRFLDGCNGYAWIFPREKNASIGVGTDIKQAKNLRRHLDGFVEQYIPNMEKPSRYGALIPAIREPGFFDKACSGPNWILIGDAAGHVNPITGEGILYALWSAELASRALTEGNPGKFDVLWKKEYYPELVEACRLVRFIYNARALDFFIKKASRSQAAERILAELFTNAQSYRGLFKRVIASLPGILLPSASD